MYRRIFAAILFFSAAVLSLVAQIKGRISAEFNVDSFPNVNFVYHSYNPQPLEASDFRSLKEAGNSVPFSVAELPGESKTDKQTVIILWEDMAHNGLEQYNFTRNVLTIFFENIQLSANDKIAIAAFNRRKNAPSALNRLSGDFTSDKSTLINAVKSYKPSTEHYPQFPNRSDMYTAIRESMDLLSKTSGAKAIIVFTSGYSMKNSGSDSEAQVLLKAQQEHIPVYIFQYYLKSGVAPESEGFAKSSYGSFQSFKYVDDASDALINLYPHISDRYNGHKYLLKFKSTGTRGDGLRNIDMNVDGEELHSQYLLPEHTFSSWCANYWWVILACIVILGGLITCVILLARKSKERDSKNQRELEALEQRRLQDKADAEDNQRQMVEAVRQEQENRRQKTEDKHLQDLMYLKGSFPRLAYQNGATTSIYEICHPRTRIGRDADNDLVLDNTTVSRHHAEILFNGRSFDIIDCGSTNKVRVNGCITERATLRAGDVIEIGKSTLKFI